MEIFKWYVRNINSNTKYVIMTLYFLIGFVPFPGIVGKNEFTYKAVPDQATHTLYEEILPRYLIGLLTVNVVV